MGWSLSSGGCIKTGKSVDFSVLKVFRLKFKELKVSYKAKKLDSSFSFSKTFDTPPSDDFLVPANWPDRSFFPSSAGV
ncbi:MAG: hypothetical protein BRD49_00015 [Bacteroidetes bacterium SW_10_40_5]|nr:MAG: hypothetical protein BRD49_00015 [Bacteroidetes bacterium SW_10_40_5]